MRPFVILAVGGAVLAGIPFATADRYILTVLTTVLVWAYLSSSWNILGGLAGQLSFGHGIFLGTGAYASGALFANWGWHPLVGGGLGIGLSCVAALAIGYVSVRYRLVHLHFALVTTAMSQVALFFAMAFDFIGGVNGISLPYRATEAELFFREPAAYYWIFLGMTVAVVGLTLLIRNRRMGLNFLCIRESEVAAAGIGIDVTREKLVAMVLSAGLTAAGGVMYAQYIRFLDPDSMFGWAVSLQIVIPAMLGGTQAIFGPVVGSSIYVLLQELTRTWFDFAGASLLIVGVVLVPVVMFLPEGIIPSLQAYARRFRRSSEAPRKAGRDVRLAPAPSQQPVADPLLRVEGLSRRFGGVQAVANVSLSCGHGERLGIIGPNGAGKSTLFALIGGFVQPDAGQIWFDGRRIDGLPAEAICQLGLARTFQTAQPFRQLSVFDNVLASAYLRAATDQDARAATWEILELFELAHAHATVSGDLNVADQKRIELARAYATQPRLILLDEVGAGLTPLELARLTDILRRINAQQGTAIIFIEHVMSMVASLAERVVVLHHGQVLAQGNIGEVATNPLVVEAYLGESQLVATG